MKTRNCDECAHFPIIRVFLLRGECNVGHAPRYYLPRSAVDCNYGWKRRCADFVERKELREQGESK